MNPFEYIKQRITDIADVNVAINGRDPSWGYADLMELLVNIEEAYNDRYRSPDTISRQAAIDAADKIIERDTSGSNAVVNAMIAWSEYIKTLPSAQPERKMCNLCKYYEGVHRVQGHAPCSFWKIGGVMYDDYCSRWEKFDE